MDFIINYMFRRQCDYNLGAVKVVRSYRRYLKVIIKKTNKTQTK